MSYRVVSNIVDFSDDILLHIFSYLKSWDLVNVIETCQRLNKVGNDHSLWKEADFSDGFLTASQVSRRVVHCLQACTKHLHLRGRKKKLISKYKWKTDLLTPALVKNIIKNSPNLEELIISEAIVDASKLRLPIFGDFKKLRGFCLSDCEYINLPSPVTDGSYFKGMCTMFPNIESLEISKCNWITDYDLMILSKLDSLKKLCLKCDLRIGFTIAYLSISFRFGFKNLEELDLRGTSLQNSDVHPIIQGGKLKSLSIGPVGRVKRVSDSVDDDGLNLIISDPYRREEPRQQVVVINMGPNGPHWRQANEEELDNMGLHWVKNGLNQCRQKVEREEEPLHFFFGREGKIVKGNPKKKIGECSNTQDKNSSSKKRKCEDEGETSSKRFQPDNADKVDTDDDDDDDDDDDEEDNVAGDVEEDPKSTANEDSLSTEESNLPDEFLSDIMVHAFKDYAKELQNLILAGCAITNIGLQELIKYTPSLKYLDISNTYITDEGIQEARELLPECKFIYSPRALQDGR